MKLSQTMDLHSPDDTLTHFAYKMVTWGVNEKGELTPPEDPATEKIRKKYRKVFTNHIKNHTIGGVIKAGGPGSGRVSQFLEDKGYHRTKDGYGPTAIYVHPNTGVKVAVDDRYDSWRSKISEGKGSLELEHHLAELRHIDAGGPGSGRHKAFVWSPGSNQQRVSYNGERIGAVFKGLAGNWEAKHLVNNSISSHRSKKEAKDKVIDTYIAHKNLKAGSLTNKKFSPVSVLRDRITMKVDQKTGEIDLPKVKAGGPGSGRHPYGRKTKVVNKNERFKHGAPLPSHWPEQPKLIGIKNRFRRVLNKIPKAHLKGLEFIQIGGRLPMIDYFEKQAKLEVGKSYEGIHFSPPFSKKEREKFGNGKEPIPSISLRKKADSYTLAHEIGHHVYDVLLSSKQREKWKKESGGQVGEFNKTNWIGGNRREAFANAYALAIGGDRAGATIDYFEMPSQKSVELARKMAFGLKAGGVGSGRKPSYAKGLNKWKSEEKEREAARKDPKQLKLPLKSGEVNVERESGPISRKLGTKITKQGTQFCVDGDYKDSLGCYPSKNQAERVSKGGSFIDFEGKDLDAGLKIKPVGHKLTSPSMHKGIGRNHRLPNPSFKVKAGGPGSGRRCYACDRKLGINSNIAITSDGAQIVDVGRECSKLIEKSKANGYKPPLGGPRLYSIKHMSPSDKSTKEALRLTLHRLKIKADAGGEPNAGAFSTAHIEPYLWFTPPSLKDRGKGNHVPVDDPQNKDDKFLDVTKRDSKDTQEQRMKLLKRKAPAGLPALIPAHTTLVSPHTAVYIPGSLNASRKKINRIVHPVQYIKRAGFISYQRRGCL